MSRIFGERRHRPPKWKKAMEENLANILAVKLYNWLYEVIY